MALRSGSEVTVWHQRHCKREKNRVRLAARHAAVGEVPPDAERRRSGPISSDSAITLRLFVYSCIRVFVSVKNIGKLSMALRDLIAQKAKLTEEAIEAIIGDYVRYDIEAQEIVLTPDASGLSSKAKVLVFLVAQQGWQFVQDEATDVALAPSQLGEFLGIQGGTLRPILKDLKDRNLLAVKSGMYTVRSTSFDAIKAELDGNRVSTSQKTRKTRTRKKSRAKAKQASAPKSGSMKRKQSSARSGQSPGETFKGIVSEGFFDSGRTMAELQARLHERAVIVKQTSLPSYLLAAVRDGRLKREKQEVGGKRVWVYTSMK